MEKGIFEWRSDLKIQIESGKVVEFRHFRASGLVEKRYEKITSSNFIFEIIMASSRGEDFALFKAIDFEDETRRVYSFGKKDAEKFSDYFKSKANHGIWIFGSETIESQAVPDLVELLKDVSRLGFFVFLDLDGLLVAARSDP